MSDSDQLSEDFDDYELELDEEDTTKGFRIRNPLPPPRAQQWSTADLHGEFPVRKAKLYDQMRL